MTTAIQRERELASTVRAIWPTDDDTYNFKVFRIQQILRNTGRSTDAEMLTPAYRAAWRKQNRILLQTHGRSHGLPYSNGNVNLSDWGRRAYVLTVATDTAVGIAKDALLLTEKTGPASASLRLLDAAYWTVKDLLDDIRVAQGAIPRSKSARSYYTHRLAINLHVLSEAMAELVIRAVIYNHTITR